MKGKEKGIFAMRSQKDGQGGQSGCCTVLTIQPCFHSDPLHPHITSHHICNLSFPLSRFCCPSASHSTRSTRSFPLRSSPFPLPSSLFPIPSSLPPISLTQLQRGAGPGLVLLAAKSARSHAARLTSSLSASLSPPCLLCSVCWPCLGSQENDPKSPLAER